MDQRRFPAGLGETGARSGPDEGSATELIRRIEAATASSDRERPQLSVVIIAYNEENRIRPCIESVFDACGDLEDFEIILVDSNSTDRTVEYATQYPITVLRIADDNLTSPSAGRYVGTQVASAETILFVDGDMTLKETWLSNALDYLKTHDDVAAVEGHLNYSNETEVEEVDELGGIMLCDAAALEAVGGFDPYLLSNEDIDISYQLKTAEYRLVCLPEVSVMHHEDQSVTEPFRRWQYGYHAGPGQMIRKWIGSPPILKRLLRRQKYKVGLLAWLGVGTVSLPVPPLVVVWALVSLVVFGVVASRLGVRGAINFVIAKALGVVGLFVGLRRGTPPAEEFPLSAVQVVATGQSIEASQLNLSGESKSGLESER